MRCSFLALFIAVTLLLPVFAADSDRNLVTYHWWLSYKELPYAAYPMGLPDSKFHVKGYSPTFGYSPLAVLHAETDLDPLCSIRFRTEGFEEINPFKKVIWRPNEIVSENNFKEDKKIKMTTAFVNPDSSVSTVVLSNSGKTPWKQELVFYSKGTAVLQEDYIARKAVTVTSPFKSGVSAMGIFFDKSTIEDIFTFQENGRYRIITKINIPPGSEVSFSIGVGFANEASPRVVSEVFDGGVAGNGADDLGFVAGSIVFVDSLPDDMITRNLNLPPLKNPKYPFVHVSIP